MTLRLDPIDSENRELVAFVQSCPLFGEQPLDVLAQLLLFSDIVVVGRGETLLRQGQENDRLFVLMSGVLAVAVDGNRLATIDRRGDLVGEVSVVTGRRCSATIIAESDAQLFSVQVRPLTELGLGGNGDVERVLYRIYSIILAEKLLVTNEKAKQFEAMNTELAVAQVALQLYRDELESKVEARTHDLRIKTLALESSNVQLTEQHAVLLAGYRRLEDLGAARAVTIQRLSELSEDKVPKLRQALEVAIAAGAPRAALRPAYLASDELSAAVSAILARQAAEGLWKSRRVLLIESERKQQQIAKVALGGTGVVLDVAADAAELAALVDAHRYDIICAGHDGLELAKMAHERNPGAPVVFMTSGTAAEYLPELRRSPFITSVVARDDGDRAFTVKNILITIGKIANRDIFGLEKYLSWGIEVQRRPVAGSAQRWEQLEELGQYFDGLGLRESRRNRCVAVAEELLSNAIYDAPVDSEGRPLYNHRPRTEAVDLKPEERAELRFACDGVLAAVSVADPFGALRRDTILDYLESCYQGRHGSLNERKGGAGMGTYQVIESADLVVFNVKPGVRTEVIALFRLDQKAGRDFDGKSFHYFSDG